MASERTSHNPNNVAEMLKEEADIHDEDYKEKYPFWGNSFRIDPDHVWKICDYCYKKGAYIRGYRTRRLFELIDIHNIRDKKILDVACGNGQHAVLYAIYGAKVSGFE